MRMPFEVHPDPNATSPGSTRGEPPFPVSGNDRSPFDEDQHSSAAADQDLERIESVVANLRRSQSFHASRAVSSPPLPRQRSGHGWRIFGALLLVALVAAGMLFVTVKDFRSDPVAAISDATTELGSLVHRLFAYTGSTSEDDPVEPEPIVVAEAQPTISPNLANVAARTTPENVMLRAGDGAPSKAEADPNTERGPRRLTTEEMAALLQQAARDTRSAPIEAQPQPQEKLQEKAPEKLQEKPRDELQDKPQETRRKLDGDEIALLLKRGEDLIGVGDFVSARVVLQRAAESGHATAALMLAGTYDPLILEKFGLQKSADVAQARTWYERAKEFGSTEAARRIEILASWRL